MVTSNVNNPTFITKYVSLMPGGSGGLAHSYTHLTLAIAILGPDIHACLHMVRVECNGTLAP